TFSCCISDCLTKQTTIPRMLHQKLSKFCRTTIDLSLILETGSNTFPYCALNNIWYQSGTSTETIDDAKLYVECADVMHKRSEEVKSLYSMWEMFWQSIVMKYPDLASDHIEQFLNDFIDRKQMSMLMILQGFEKIFIDKI
ncbi:unnamed protein product, partial [Didymodactylos carnosus]